MDNFFKFNSDKSYVHEITYLVDAEYKIKRNPNKSYMTLIKTIKHNNWYTNRGKNISEKVHQIINEKDKNIFKRIDRIKAILAK